MLLSGCVTPSGDFCDVAVILYFERQEVVDYLAQTDPALLREIVVHNELVEKCD